MTEIDEKLCDFVKKSKEDKSLRPLKDHLVEALLEQIMNGDREISALMTEQPTGNVYVCFSFTKGTKKTKKGEIMNYDYNAKCKHCKWSKAGGRWISECRNKECYYYGDECIEKQGYDDREPCDEKEEADE